MAKYLVEKDKKKRNFFFLSEKKNVALKTLLNGRVAGTKHRSSVSRSLHKIVTRNSSVVRIHNRCIVTGRPRSIYRFCRLSRIKFRDSASKGLLPGVRKSSW